MNLWSLDAPTVSHSIQLALAPVFFLTAVAGMIGSMAGRLARIIDRARKIEDNLHAAADAQVSTRSLQELQLLRKRGRLANIAIALLTLCGLSIGLTIVLLFVGEAYGFNGHRYAVISFLGGILAFLLALCCFLWETILATRVLDFQIIYDMQAAQQVRHVQQVQSKPPTQPPSPTLQPPPQP